jgi:hypothetical protein
LSFSSDIKLSADSRYWYPFIYTENDEIKGMHIDLIKKALKDCGFNTTINAYPRKRAVMSAESGLVDGIISIGFNSDFNVIYPKDADPENESGWSIMQIDHVVVTPPMEYDYTGEISTIPLPVRIPRGESLADIFVKKGIQVDLAATDDQNFKKMFRDRSGSVITTTILAEEVYRKEGKGKMKIHSQPIASKPYFLAFSKKTAIGKNDMEKIWERIRELKADYIFMLKLYSKY